MLESLPAIFLPALAPTLSPTRLSAPDLTVVTVYLVAITLFGLGFSRKSKLTPQPGASSLKTYFLAGNTIPWWAIALSIVSAETSTLTIISVPGVAFAGNFGFLQIVLGYMLGRIVVALLFLPRYFRGEMLTAYQLIDRRFGPALYKLTAGLFLLTRAAAEGVRVFAISIVVGIAIGTGDTLSIAIISALTLLYTFEGGMAAVIWTDVVQMILYVAGTLVALFTLGAHVPGGWTHIHAVAAPLGKFRIFDFTLNLTTTYTFWAGVLGGTFLTMASHGTDQLMVQRMLAARNLRESRLALLSSGAIIFLQFTLFLLIGAGLFVFYAAHPHTFSSSDRIFPTFIVQQMPRGVAGLLVAAILAAAMSNLSAALNSLASTTVVDFYLPFLTRKKKVPHSSQSHRDEWVPQNSTPEPVSSSPNTTLISRAATVFWAFVLFAIAVYSIHAGGKGHVVETGLSIASVAYGCLLGVFLLGTLTPRHSMYGATQSGAIVGMICGLTLNLSLWLLPTNPPWGWTYTTPTATRYIPMPHIAFTWYVLIGSLTTFVIGSVASLLLPKRRKALATSAVALVLSLLGLSSHSAAQGPASAPAVASSATFAAPPLRPLRSAFALAPGTQKAPDFSPVSALITEAIAAGKLPGGVVLIGHNNHIVFEQASGNRKLAGEPGLDGKPSPAEPMTTDTIFDMASLTKVLVTTTAILQLYEQGKLDLDTPVAHYLPEFAANGKEKITIRELLTHYSGLPEDVSLKDPWGLTAPDKAEGIRRALASTPYGPPGITFKYSDINFITLGSLVEQLTGERLDRYSYTHIFTPLGMSNTSFYAYNTPCGWTLPPYGHGLGEGHDKWPSATNGIQIRSCTNTPLTRFLDRYAPTAHDNEGIALTNPNFDHLLRGTVHDPTARRMGGVAGHAGVFSTAEDTARFAQALLDKLLTNTGPFPLNQATLREATSPQAPESASNTATIFTPAGETTKGIAQRGLGWDLNSPFSRPRGELFPITKAGHPGSFGHTGFTGTSLWLDPTSNTYVILLSNAIHPHVGPNISPLRGQVATAAARAFGITSGAPLLAPSAMSAPLAISGSTKTLTGIDVLEQTHIAALKSLAARHNNHLRIGLLTNQAGLDARGARTIDILLHASPELELKTLFSPEHGLSATQDTERLTAEQDPTTHLPIISLYGPKSSDKHPRQSDLKQLDALVIDLQDAGVRFWTYETLVGYVLEACSRAKVEVVILDRPNPLGGLAIQGETADLGFESYTDFMPIPLRHGLTLGELARFFNDNATEVQLDPQLLDARATVIGNDTGELKPPATLPGLHAQLTVVPMQNWSRAEFFEDTGLPWTPPSPNLRTPRAAILYPALGLAEQTNLSVGRGTTTPFENLGAPWIRSEELAAYLEARKLPGVRITPTTLTIAEDPNKYPFYGQTFPSIHFEVTDPAALDTPELGIELLSALHHLYPKEFQLARARTLLANAATLAAITAGEDPRTIAATWAAPLREFRARTTQFLLYH